MADRVENTDHAPTAVRFSMRSLLVAMMVVALAATAFGAFLRQFPPETHARLLSFWGLLIVVISVVVAYRARQRLRAERQAGRVVMRLVPHSYFFPRIYWITWPVMSLAMVGVVLFMAATISVILASPDLWPIIWARLFWGPWLSLDRWVSLASVVGFICGIGYAASAICNLWWKRHVRVGENGAVVGGDFLAWCQLRRHYRDACNRGVVVLEWASQRTVAAKVPEERRAPLEVFVAERLHRHG